MVRDTTNGLKKGRRSSRPRGWLPAGATMRISLTQKQQDYCRRAIGINRFCYNLAVAVNHFQWHNDMRRSSWQDIYKAFNACKRDDYPFVLEVSSRVAEGAFMDFGRAMSRWRSGLSGPPQFKRKKSTGAGSFRAASGVDHVTYNGKRRIQVRGLGSVKLAGLLPRDAIYYEAHIRRQNGLWYIGLKCWRPPEPRAQPDTRTIGAVDTGINPNAVDSDGEVYPSPKAYYQQQGRLCRWQRAQARRVRGSGGWWEAQRRIDKCYRRINGLRHNVTHQLTNRLTRKYRMLVVESLNVRGMMGGPTPKAQADAAMGAIARQLAYKGQWRQVVMVRAAHNYPSSQICHVCKNRNAKLKRDRYWRCPTCGVQHERNENAAINLRHLVLPPGGGPRLRDGKALAVGLPNGETGSDDRRTAQLTLWQQHR